MDFQQLAVASSMNSIRRLLDSSEDDDFSHLDASVTSHHTKPDSIIDLTENQSLAADSITINENAPILSQDAEAELLMLATNFLLCK